MEIKASSVYDKKTIADFTRHSIKKLTPLYIIISAIFVFLFVIDLYNIIVFYAPVSVLVVHLLIFILFSLYLYVLIPNLNYKRQKTMTDTVNEYTFYDTKLVAISTSKGMTGTSEIEYSSLNKVFETKEYIYIYIAKEKALIINKSTITNGSVDEIHDAITSQIGIKKYKINL